MIKDYGLVYKTVVFLLSQILKDYGWIYKTVVFYIAQIIFCFFYKTCCPVTIIIKTKSIVIQTTNLKFHNISNSNYKNKQMMYSKKNKSYSMYTGSPSILTYEFSSSCNVLTNESTNGIDFAGKCKLIT